MTLKLKNSCPYVHYLIMCLQYEGFRVRFFEWNNMLFYEAYKSCWGFKKNRELMVYGYKDNIFWNFLSDSLYKYAKEKCKIKPLSFEEWKDRYFSSEIELY